MKKYALGCLKDPQDKRDLLMGMILPPIRLPKKVDYTSQMSPVRDQGDEGTCVAFATVVGVKEYQEYHERHEWIYLSPRYVYWRCKQQDGIPDQEGTYPRVAMKVLQKFGVCTEQCWAYKPHQTDFPCSRAEEEAPIYRIKTYARLRTITYMKRSLVVNGPFVAGVLVFENWFRPRVIRTGKIPLPRPGETPEGGHAVCIVGYNDRTRYFKFKNSWGMAWGEKGYGYLPYNYMRKYCLDAWCATDLIADPRPLVEVMEKILAEEAKN